MKISTFWEWKSLFLGRYTERVAELRSSVWAPLGVRVRNLPSNGCLADGVYASRTCCCTKISYEHNISLLIQLKFGSHHMENLLIYYCHFRSSIFRYIYDGLLYMKYDIDFLSVISPAHTVPDVCQTPPESETRYQNVLIIDQWLKSLNPTFDLTAVNTSDL